MCSESLTFQFLKKIVKNGLFLVHFDSRRCWGVYLEVEGLL